VLYGREKAFKDGVTEHLHELKLCPAFSKGYINNVEKVLSGDSVVESRKMGQVKHYDNLCRHPSDSFKFCNEKKILGQGTN
jgi:hypothetical protein